MPNALSDMNDDDSVACCLLVAAADASAAAAAVRMDCWILMKNSVHDPLFKRSERKLCSIPKWK